MEEFLKGKKSFLLAGIGVVLAVLAATNEWFTSNPDIVAGAGVAWIAAVAAALRAGVNKMAEK